MRATVLISGVNLEKLLRAAPAAGLTLRHVKRLGTREISAQVSLGQMKTLAALCERSGWALRELRADSALRAARFLRRRATLAAGMALCVLLVWLSSQMILRVQIDHAQENIAEVRRFLQEEGVRPGRLTSAFSLDDLRARLSLRLPGLSFVGMRYAGSTLIVDCRPAQEGEQLAIAGEGMDIVAAQPGVVTRLAVTSGTPQVEVGQAVRAGQVLISGQERTEKGGMRVVQAQGQVSARVWAIGEARVSLHETKTVETGRMRTRVTVRSPWHARVVREAEPFASQDVSREIQPVVGLYLPLWREIETYAETEVSSVPRDRAETASRAQGAAEEIAKKQCPYNALILDKWVEYDNSDDEYVRAVVVLEYEKNIESR